MKKEKKKLHEPAKLSQNMLFFSIKEYAQITFYHCTIHRKKIQKHTDAQKK